ncbi:hypothetical protein D3C85_1621590 [compost metagenome]
MTNCISTHRVARANLHVELVCERLPLFGTRSLITAREADRRIQNPVLMGLIEDRNGFFALPLLLGKPTEKCQLDARCPRQQLER